MNSNFVTVPFTVVKASISNTDVPWCADRGPQNIRIPKTMPRNEPILFFKRSLAV
jgi:hypothetical protein